jgi:tetratricopeptide (TPR) repeat protein
MERMVQANPRDAGAWSTLGALLRRAGRMAPAIACHRQGLAAVPEHGVIWSNLGNALLDTGRFDEAVAAHERAFVLCPDTVTTAFNYAIALRKTAAFERASRVLARTLALDPANPSVVWEQALTWLQTDDYARGLPAYEVRRKIPAYRNRPVPGPAWDGGPLNGRTIFLSTEQGFGDALLMMRYVPQVKARGGRVILECHNEMRRLLSALPVDEFFPAGAPFPAFDVQASLMSLPLLLGTTTATVPPPAPLSIPPEAREKAARLLGPPDGRLKVGIVWSGRVTFADNSRRATGLERFMNFLEVPGVRLYSLQKGPPESQLGELGTSALVAPLGPQFDDFADTAAVIERLDLVIMTDSSVAHLAGSLGRPIWNLIQYVPYWIYGHTGDSTPWYPTMRLFRQGRDEDWTTVFAAARQALTRLAASR